MTGDPLSQLLQHGPVLADGAMGTQLLAAGLPAGTCAEQWNVDHSDVVAGIHRAYRHAGCQLITTNTFGGCRLALARHGLAEHTHTFNRIGAAQARAAGGTEAKVLGDIGPFGGFLEPLGDTSPDELHEAFYEQARALHEGGADIGLVETMADPQEMTVAVKAAKSAASWPVIATFAFDVTGDRHYHTMMGATVVQAVEHAIAAGADAVGANCGTGLSLDDYVQLAGQLVRATESRGGVPVIIQANAGAPRMIDGRLVHPASPDEMAAMVPRLLNEGVRIIGGCCGTSPNHLRAMRRMMPN